MLRGRMPSASLALSVRLSVWSAFMMGPEDEVPHWHRGEFWKKYSPNRVRIEKYGKKFAGVLRQA